MLTWSHFETCRKLSKNTHIGMYTTCSITPEFTYPPVSVAAAIAPSHSRAGVVVNFVTATGGDVEMLRSIECFYKYAAAFSSCAFLANPLPFIGSNAYVSHF